MNFEMNDDQLRKKFYELNTRKDVADLLNINDKDLIYYLYRLRPENMYMEFKIPKRNGDFRNINAPNSQLKSVQRKLAYILNLIYRVKPAVYGFVVNRNIIMNAQRHTHKKVILNIDLKDFFTNINFGRVRGMLIKKPYGIGEKAATVIAQIACCNGVLPQGAPTSPIITNMICSPLDTQLTKLAKQYKMIYTRYADDISFSTTMASLPKEIVFVDEENKVTISHKIKNTIESNGFYINTNKIHLNRYVERQEVTGLVVNEFANVKRQYIKVLRAILFECKKKGVLYAAKRYIEEGNYVRKYIIKLLEQPDKEQLIEEWFKAVIIGKIRFIASVKGYKHPTFIKYAQECNMIFKNNIFNVANLKCQINEIYNNVVVIERDDKYRKGTGFYLKDYGLITSFFVTQDDDDHYYKAYYYDKDGDESIENILTDSNCIVKDKNSDYAIYNSCLKKDRTLELGNSTCLKVGDKITIVGYPDFLKGNMPYIQEGKITSIKSNYHGTSLYTVSARIVHGACGGPVLDSQNKVVGIIKGGIEDYTDKGTCITQGFVPVHLIKLKNDICNNKF